MKAVAYYRVSTSAQGRSGLGLDAQRTAVESLAAQRGLQLLTSFTEVESGRRNDRPRLAEALAHSKLTGAALVIAKLDRLSRNAAFLLKLRDSGVRFLAADIPDANDLTIGLLAVIAEAERQAISRRTREALAAINARIALHGAHVSSRTGREIQRLGNPGGWSGRIGGTGLAGSEATRVAANERAGRLSALFRELMEEGLSHSAVARELNKRGILTARGRQWHPSTVRNLASRLKVLAPEA